jgi:hypothetical protein
MSWQIGWSPTRQRTMLRLQSLGRVWSRLLRQEGRMPDSKAWDALTDAQRTALIERLMRFAADMIDIVLESPEHPIELSEFSAFIAAKEFVTGLESDGLGVRGPDA